MHVSVDPSPPVPMKRFNKMHPNASAKKRAEHQERIDAWRVNCEKKYSRSERINFIAFLLTFGLVSATIFFAWLCWLHGAFFVFLRYIQVTVIGCAIYAVVDTLYQAIRKKVDAKIT